MKKHLIALAALSASSAFSQSNLSFVGNLDQGVYLTSNTGRSVFTSSSYSGSSSFIGAKGDRELGNGTQASFALTGDIVLLSGQSGNYTNVPYTTSASPTNSQLFSRNAFLQLQNNDYGAIQLGRQNDAWFETMVKFNNTGVNSLGWGNAVSMANTMNSQYVAGSTTGYFSASNYGSINQAFAGSADTFVGGISYTTPTLYNLTAKFQIGMPKISYDVAGGVDQAQAISLNYSNGPLQIGFASNIRTDTTANIGATQQVFGINYKFGNYTVTYGHNESRFNNAMAASGMHDINVDGIGLGYDISPVWSVKFAYTDMKDITNSSNAFSQTAISTFYKLRSDTTWYAGYGIGNNTGASIMGLIYPGAPISSAGSSTSALLTGLRYQF